VLARLGPRLRLILFSGLLSAWMILLFVGIALGGAIHLLLLGAVVLFPWKGEA
jgi:hypothetical protein